MWRIWRNLKYLHLTNFSTDILLVLVTNMRYVVHGHWQFLVLPFFLSSFLPFCMFHVMLPKPSFCHVLHEFDKYWIRRKSDDETSRLVKICIAFKTFWQKQHWLVLDIMHLSQMQHIWNSYVPVVTHEAVQGLQVRYASFSNILTNMRKQIFASWIKACK